MDAAPPHAHPLRFLAWLILLAALAGAVSLISYALGAALLVRSDDPGLGAWWALRQYYFMEGAATALGLLVGIRIGTAFASSDEHRCHAGLAGVILAAVGLAPMIHLCAAAARFGWGGRDAALASVIISREGFELGRQVDKVAIAGIYFVKTGGFAALAGLALAAIAVIATVPTEPTAARGE